MLRPMTPAQTRLARRRLVLGIANVGFWVSAAAAGLFLLLFRGTGTLRPATAGLVLLAAVVVQAGFDFVGGAWLMPPPAPSMRRFLPGWLRGAGGHTLILAGVWWLGGVSFRWTGGFLPAVVLATAGLALGRRRLLSLLGGVATTGTASHGAAILVAQTGDPAFTGGIVGRGRDARSLLPAAWLQGLPGDELAAESARRDWQRAAGLPDRALLWVLGWNLAGAGAGAWALGLSHRLPAEALLLHTCWMTLWTFGSLLILPSLSRRSVYAADRAAQAAGHDPRGWIARFPTLVGEDGGATAFVQTIFYPIPSAARRLQELDGPPAAGFVFGSLARSNLYYSWATGTLLGRAVHCNVGRPALWVFPPSA